MFKNITDKINFSFETDVTKGTHDIMTSIKEKAQGHKWYSFLTPGQIDYKEFKFFDNEIEIRRTPSTFWPFRALGKIKLTFCEINPTETKVKCEVKTWNNSALVLMTIQTGVILLWSIFWVLLGWRLDLLTRFGTPVGVLILFNGISVIKIMTDRRSLIDYSHTLIKLIKE
jgi:hypothetical protein